MECVLKHSVLIEKPEASVRPTDLETVAIEKMVLTVPERRTHLPRARGANAFGVRQRESRLKP